MRTNLRRAMFASLTGGLVVVAVGWGGAPRTVHGAGGDAPGTGACTTTMTGPHTGTLSLSSPGTTTCLNNANQNGAITVSSGAALSVINSTVTGAITSTSTAPFTFCNSKTVQGISKVDMKFTSYGKDFALAAPNNVFDFDDPTTWPPRYQVDAVHQQEASAGSCGDPCVLSADVENTGGLNGAAAPSTVTFVLTASDQSSLGSCKATIQPDRPHGQKFTVSCSIQTSAWTNYAGDYKYGATADNPAYD